MKMQDGLKTQTVGDYFHLQASLGCSINIYTKVLLTPYKLLI